MAAVEKWGSRRRLTISSNRTSRSFRRIHVDMKRYFHNKSGNLSRDQIAATAQTATGFVAHNNAPCCESLFFARSVCSGSR
jgi:hypothetical protein